MNPRLALPLLALVLPLSACGSDPVTAPTPAVTVTETSVAPAPQPTASSAGTAPVAPAPAATTVPAATTPAVAANFTMPSLVGQNLQEAQDALQVLTANPVFVSTSSDALGQGRNQVLDSGWQVCSQTPAAGTSFSQDSPPDLKVVRLTEACP